MLKQVCSYVGDFVHALNDQALDACQLPRPEQLPAGVPAASCLLLAACSFALCWGKFAVCA